jgi:L-ascorbate metabolism protein UlaG (beta-lactamase superfamily)
MIKPLLFGDDLLADIESTKRAPDGFRLWWLGQSGFLVQWNGRHLLFDPYLSDSLTEKYADTDKPHTRMTELAVNPSCLDFIDVVTSSHNHTDHLDRETLCPLLEANPNMALIVPAANRSFVAERLQVEQQRLTTLDDGQDIDVAGFTVHAVPAAHETVEQDERDRCRFLGYVVQFGDWTIYHSGDTVLYDEMVERLTSWSIDVAILPINGRGPERRVAGNLWGREAAKLAHDIGARLVIPCHYEMFEFNTASPDEFISEARRLGQGYCVLRCGEPWSSVQAR